MVLSVLAIAVVAKIWVVKDSLHA